MKETLKKNYSRVSEVWKIELDSGITATPTTIWVLLGEVNRLSLKNTKMSFTFGATSHDNVCEHAYPNVVGDRVHRPYRGLLFVVSICWIACSHEQSFFNTQGKARWVGAYRCARFTRVLKRGYLLSPTLVCCALTRLLWINFPAGDCAGVDGKER